jgi:hypothetical protein
VYASKTYEENLHVIPNAKGTLKTMFDDTDKLALKKVKEILGEQNGG